MLNRAIQEPAEDPKASPGELPSQPADAASNVLPFRAADEAPMRLPRRALIYVLAVFILGAAAIGWYAPQLDTSDWFGFLVLALLAITLGRTRLLIYGDTTVSIAMVGDFAVVFLFGPAGAVLIGPLAGLITDYGTGSPWYKRVFNIGTFTLVNGATAAVAWALMGDRFIGNAWLIPIALVAAVCYYLVNITLVTP